MALLVPLPASAEEDVADAVLVEPLEALEDFLCFDDDDVDEDPI